MVHIPSALITGGVGFLGSQITRELRKKYPECTVTVLDLIPPSSSRAIEGVCYRRGDVTNAKEVLDVVQDIRPALIIHTAGKVPKVHLRYGQLERPQMFQINVEGTRNVFDAAKAAGVQAFIYTSSITVALDAIDLEQINVTEDYPRIGKFLDYGESKVWSPIKIEPTAF